ncbi:MAG: hypothetical protein K0S61_1061 [Anaerocolumna sp.]|jgi:3-oxoacyl-[acyl-carrier-protein] synthase-3|nr:hypothetical protein [Anaerocolumna sp.]
MIGITYMDYYLGKQEADIEKVLKESNLKDSVNLDEKEFKEKLNYISQMSQCNTIVYDEKESHVMVYESLIENFLENTKVDPNDIIGLFFTDIYNFKNDGINIPFYIQHKYKMECTTVVSLNQQCSGTLAAMKLSSSLLENTEDKYVIILTSCFMDNFTDRYHGDCLIGDGAGIVVVSNKNYVYKIRGSSLKSYGELSYRKQIKDNVKINNIKLAQKYKQAMEEAVTNSGIMMDEIDKIICQNTNYYFNTNVMLKLLKINKNIVFMENKEYGGHIGDVDIVRNLKDFTKQKKDDNRFILLIAIGSYDCSEGDRSIASLVLEKV